MADADQDNWIDTIASYGAKAVRVWVNGQGGDGHCEKGSRLAYGVPQLEENGLGNYSIETLDLLDRTLVKLASRGLKAIISPHDGNALFPDYRWYVTVAPPTFPPHTGQLGMLTGWMVSDAYCKKWGAAYFYEAADAAEQFDRRLDYILNYRGATSGKVWKNWHTAIAAFDVQVSIYIVPTFLTIHATTSY
jgi:mannan endo-1,4-beta-mannosidase